MFKSFDILFWLTPLSIISLLNFVMLMAWKYNANRYWKASKKNVTKKEKAEMGRRLMTVLKEHEIENQAQLAGEYGVSPMNVSRWITGKDFPPEDFLLFLYNHFQINIGFLLTGKGSSHVKPWKK